MTNVEGEEVDDFIATGRVGRRNALPDILNDKHAGTSTADLPDTLSKLTCSGRSALLTYEILRLTILCPELIPALNIKLDSLFCQKERGWSNA